MEFVRKYTREHIFQLIRKRTGEEKIGETVEVLLPEWKNDLTKSKSKFVIIGIPEDIGVRANYGRAGANTAFKPALESFLSQQSNSYLNGENICVLGEIVVDDLMEKASHLNTKNKSEIDSLRELVSLVDERVTQVIHDIVAAGKIPVIIGGGHNNAYGNIKGCSTALKRNINVINCDPHLDFRAMDGRHSGNGFSYAFDEGHLNKYAVVCMHEQYNNKGALDTFTSNPAQLIFNTYESVFVREDLEFKTAIDQCVSFVKENYCGIELDLDSITNVPSSAKTSSGISPIQARQYVYKCANNLNAVYFHIAEGAPVLSHIKADNKTGKLIAYLMTDFIKGVLNKEQ